MRQTDATYMYLDYCDWSARYDATCFYTIQMQGYVWVTSQEHLHQLHQQDHGEQQNLSENGDIASSIRHSMPTNTRLPTYYYKIIVYRGYHQNIIYRSYKQFEWLHEQLRITTPLQQLHSNGSLEAIVIPHPLQGERSKDECNFLGGHCWVVQQIQQFIDYLEQQQRHKHSTVAANKKEATSLMGSENYTSKFAETRCQQLSYFLTTVLQQRGSSSSLPSTSEIIYPNHGAVRTFLEL